MHNSAYLPFSTCAWCQESSSCKAFLSLVLRPKLNTSLHLFTPTSCEVIASCVWSELALLKNPSICVCSVSSLTIMLVCVCLFVCPIINDEQQMNSSIGWINMFSESPGGQRQKGVREQRKVRETKPERRRSIECVFLWLNYCPQWLWKEG